MGAVHDFGALVMSLRNQGKSISEVTAKYINPRVRTIFFIIVFLELWIVIAIFGLIIAIIFAIYPQSVFPVWMEIPIALLLGWVIYKKGGNVALFSILAIIGMYVTVVLGVFIPINLPTIAGIPPTGVWTVILLIYAYIASTLPVTTLLQPRDYMNSHELLIVMVLLVVGVIVTGAAGALHVVAPAVQATPEGAPPLWPFLFITIACGAISGFHSLVASGTSSKQVRQEEDALFVGYGSMIMEGVLATLVIIACVAGIGIAYKGSEGALLTGTAAWTAHYKSWAAAAGLGSKIGAFVVGSANMISSFGIPNNIAIVIMGVFVASFAGTTLDTATRIQRYVIQELSGDAKINALKNGYVATAVAVVTAGVLAFANGASGKGALTLWPLFGATNQILASLALLAITVYLKKKGKGSYLISGLPAIFMMVMTTWALIKNEINFITAGNALLSVINAVVVLIAIWVAIEGWLTVFSVQKPPKEVASKA